MVNHDSPSANNGKSSVLGRGAALVAAAFRFIDAAIESLGTRARNLAALVALLLAALVYLGYPRDPHQTPAPLAVPEKASSCHNSVAPLLEMMRKSNPTKSADVDDLFRKVLRGKRVCLILEVQLPATKLDGGAQRVGLNSDLADFPTPVIVFADTKADYQTLKVGDVVRLEGVMTRLLLSERHERLEFYLTDASMSTRWW